MTGEYLQNYENGQLKVKGNFNSEGLLTGNWKYFFNNGQLWRDETYNNGIKVDKWIYYEPTGTK